MTMQVCAAWATPDRMCSEGDGTTDDCVEGTVPLEYPFTDDELLLAASNILYARTGFRWPGVCGPFDVWPCIDNCFSERHECVPCCAYNVVALPTDRPVLSIESITEDGVALDPSNYRLERRGRIVRTDGKAWQRNTFGLPCADGRGVETIISITVGATPPIEGVMAAAALADEMKKACNGGECGPGSKLSSYARRGVSVDLVDLEQLMKSGATGVPAVDRFIAAHGERRSMTLVDPARRSRGSRVT